ncbi:MAG: pilus assembly protein TadG-related protein [Candidatus Omnitrophica bacterium]|nr:pilus assembly protein TadG-related protein [Candidatus Omnitrophota bacterium]
MLFSWFDKNKHFKKAGGIKAQVAPFLIIALVILIIATIATVNIGRVALDKTETGNAADAGSLAAASVMADYLNAFAEGNKLLFETSNELFAEETYLLGEIEDELDTPELLYYGAITATSAVIALWLSPWPQLTVVCGYAECSSNWLESGTKAAALVVLTAAAQYLLNETWPYLPPIKADLEYLIAFYQYHYDLTHNLLCQIISMMDEAPAAAKSAALSLAFANSGIPGKLSEPQQDEYQAWIKAEGYNNSGNYPWRDKLDQPHRVSVEASVSGVDSYGIMYPPYTLTQAKQILQECVDYITEVYDTITDAMERNVRAMSYFGFSGGFWVMAGWACNQLFTCKGYDCILWAILAILSAVLAIVMCGSAMEQIFANEINLLTGWDYFNNIEDRIADIKANLTLATVEDSEISSCRGATDLFVIQVTSINMNYCVQTKVWGEHGRGEYGGSNKSFLNFIYPNIASNSTACFDGGDVIEGGYEARLTDAN